MNEERIREVFSDKAFVEELLSIHEPEKIQALLEAKDIEVSIAEIEKFKEMVMKKLENLILFNMRKSGGKLRADLQVLTMVRCYTASLKPIRRVQL